MPRILDILIKLVEAILDILHNQDILHNLDTHHSLDILVRLTHMVTTILDIIKVTHRHIHLKETILKGTHKDISKVIHKDIRKDISLLLLLSVKSLILETS